MFKRIKVMIIFFIMGVLTLSLGCGSKSTEVSTRPLNTDSTASIISYKLPNMEKVNIKRDIVYEDYNKLKLDVYYPLGNRDISKTPTVVIVHGVADDNNLKDSDIYKSWGKVIAASGFTAVNFNWRPSLSASMDISDLIKYIRENAGKLKINGENICILAFSAGVSKGVRDAMQINTGFIKKVIVYYGQIDEAILTLNTNVKLPSFFIAMGARDEIFSPDTNDGFISKAKESGCNVIKMIHPSGVHSFDIFNNDGQTKNIIDETLKFIEDDSDL